MSEWKEIKLNDYVDSISKTFKFTSKPVVFLNTSDILEGKVLHNNTSDPKSLPGQAKKSIKKGDLLFSEIRPANKRYALVDFDADDFVVSTKLMVLRAKNEINNSFLKLYLTSPEILNYLQMIAEDRSGSFPQITFDNIKSLELLLPPLPEQESIAEVLSSLDDKIDLLHRQNKTLEQMAETLFRQWFVEDAEDSWEEKSLDQIAEYLNGLALQKFPAEKGQTSLPAIKIREMNQGITEATDRVSCNLPPKYIIENGDILFSWSGSLDVKIWTGGQGALNQHLFKVSSGIYPKWLIYFATRLFLPEFRDIANDKATTMGHIQRGHLTQSTIKLPEIKIINKYDKIISGPFNKIIKNQLQIQQLEKLRDTLLPKLMSGAVRVKN
jgi:type I restriction enzyme S subunit